MQKLYSLFLFTALCFLGINLNAQDCFYELEMIDSFGDGWNGGELTISLDGDSTVYTLTNNLGDGLFFALCFPVTSGQIMALSYESGAFANEVSFNIIDNDGNRIYESTMGPMVGDSIFLDTIECADCIAPSFCSNIEFDRLRSNSVDFFWNSVVLGEGEMPVYLVEFGPSGFIPNTGAGTFLTTTDTIFRVQPLEDTTAYDVYISTLCSMGTDTSAFRGPFSFITPLSNDVGVTIITDPVSGCDIGSQQIRIGLTNFGGQAQSFIPFDFSINGEPSGVDMPADGLYTGVLGVDSTEFTTFDAFANLPAPGEYEVKIWTALDGDQDTSNDTLTVVFTSTEILEELPYFEDFEASDGNWTVVQGGTGEASWEWGLPEGNLINSAGSGQSSWVTNLTGNYNNNENSFLLSPCFDFTLLEEDPIFSMLLYVETENNFDELFVEYSIDNQEWVRLGDAGTGVNWYNDPFNNWWENDGGFGDNWVIAAQTLTGLAGEEQVRFRVVFSSDGSVLREGCGIDNVYIGPQFTNDLAATGLASNNLAVCGTPNDSLTLTFYNLGSSTATEISLNYQVNEGDVVTEAFPDTLGVGESATYTFTTPYDGSLANTNEIVAWTTISGDGFILNDSTSISVATSQALPLFESFEAGAPMGWNFDTDLQFLQAHNSNSTVLFDNLFSGDTLLRAVTPNVGPIMEGDTLFFDYRITDFVGDGSIGTELQADSIVVRIIPNCDSIATTVLRIDSTNHIPTAEITEVAIPLDEDFSGSSIQIVFEAYWAAGDYFVDIDNINIRRCPPSLGLQVDITDASTNGSSDGMVTVLPTQGVGPFTYSWSNDAITMDLIDVMAGEYDLTVRDAQGCSESISLVVGFLVGANDFGAELGSITAAPNPTRDQLNIFIDLVEQRSLRMQLYNQLGQPIITRELGKQQVAREQIDLSNFPAGVYYLRVFAGEQYQTLRVVKTR